MTNDEDETQAKPVVKVAGDLTEVLDLCVRLYAQALHHATDQLMPGGHAMVALGPEARLEEWAENLAYDELYHLATCDKPTHTRCAYDWRAADEDDQHHEPPLQTLLFWSEEWRNTHGYPLGERRPTIISEASFLRRLLNWAWDHEVHWDDFARDVGAVRRRLEDILHCGMRSERGAPCMYEGCKGKRLVRKLQPRRDVEGRKIWVFSPWHCPSCHREWDDDAYARMVTAAHEAAKVEVINGEEWVSPDLAARRLDRPQSTIRQWVHRREVAVVCIRSGKRAGFVRFADVLERHDGAARRKRAS